MTALIWFGIAVCITQSAMMSGLNLAYFTVGKLELEIEVSKGNPHARRVRELRKDANFLLATILWGNVSVNVLLALLSGSVLAGVAAFLFSTVVITIIGEIIPQAYFSRHALRIGALFAPAIRAYQIILYPVAKTTAIVLNHWLGEEAVKYYREQDLRELLKLHMVSAKSDIARVEGQGALNFLAIDDVPLAEEGEPLDPDSIITLEFDGQRPVLPSAPSEAFDALMQRVQKSRKKWVVLADQHQTPQLILNANRAIREVMIQPGTFNLLRCCHQPIIAHKEQTVIGQILPRFKSKPHRREDDVIDEDVILVWSDRRRIITGADILGRLLRGISEHSGDGDQPQPDPTGIRS